MKTEKDVMFIARSFFDVAKCSGKLLEKLEDGKEDKIPAGFDKVVYSAGDTITVTAENLTAVNTGFDLKARAAKRQTLAKLYGKKAATVTAEGEPIETVL
jgi:hypothetical protein